MSEGCEKAFSPHVSIDRPIILQLGKELLLDQRDMLICEIQFIFLLSHCRSFSGNKS